MVFPLYFAMTAGEVRQCREFPPQLAWMSCHFSSYSTNLSNCPQSLPEGSILIVDDSTPLENHDLTQIAHQLAELTEHLHVSSVLLDFQRQDNPKAQELAQKLPKALACPVGVSEPYAKDLDCPVFLPPPPVYLPLSQYLEAWHGREIWLEAALSRQCVVITPEGFRLAEDIPESESPLHFSKELSCHYRIIPEKNQICFSLHRTREDLMSLLVSAEALGVTKAIGLYQELG